MPKLKKFSEMKATPGPGAGREAEDRVSALTKPWAVLLNDNVMENPKHADGRSNGQIGIPLAAKIGTVAVFAAATAGARLLSRRRRRKRRDETALEIPSGPCQQSPANEFEDAKVDDKTSYRRFVLDPPGEGRGLRPCVVETPNSYLNDPDISFEPQMETPGNTPRSRPLWTLSAEEEEEIAALCNESLELDVSLESAAVIESVIEALCNMDCTAGMIPEPSWDGELDYAGASANTCQNASQEEMQSSSELNKKLRIEEVSVAEQDSLEYQDHPRRFRSPLMPDETHEELEQLARQQLVSAMQAYARKIIHGQTDLDGNDQEVDGNESVEWTGGTTPEYPAKTPPRSVCIDVYAHSHRH